MIANRDGRRWFGSIRKLPSGRYQARYLGPGGLERKAPMTFAKDKDASRWLTVVESEIIQGVWSAPEAGEVELAGYGRQWIAERKLQPRTREMYEDLFRLHVEPHLGSLVLGEIKPQTIRTWRKKLLDGGTPEPQAVKAYCLLRAIFTTAVKEDEILRLNPCRIKGYDTYRTPERPVANSEAGVRTVSLPATAVKAPANAPRRLRRAGTDAMIFTGAKGATLRSANFTRAVRWSTTRVQAGLPPNFTFHDLRHTGNNLAAASGASTRELMHRMGHASMRAALIYQHATSERDSEIAAAMDKRITRKPSGRGRSDQGESGG